MGKVWPTPIPSEKVWPTPIPSEKVWPTPIPSKKKTDEPSKKKDSWPSEKKESEDAINLLLSTLDEPTSIKKWSAHSVNDNDDDNDDDDDGDDDDEDKYKDALVVVWKPLDILTFLQLVGILTVMLTFCFVLRGMCFKPRNERKGAKMVSDYDSDDLTDTEDELEISL